MNMMMASGNKALMATAERDIQKGKVEEEGKKLAGEIQLWTEREGKFAVYEDEHIYGDPLNTEHRSQYVKNEAQRKEDYESWFATYTIAERKSKKVQIMNQVNAAQTKHELEEAVAAAKQLGGGRYAAFTEDDLRRLHRRIKEKHKEEQEASWSMDETIQVLYQQLCMALKARDPKYTEQAIKDLQQCCKGVTKKHDRLMMLARAEIPIFMQEIEETRKMKMLETLEKDLARGKKELVTAKRELIKAKADLDSARPTADGRAGGSADEGEEEENGSEGDPDQLEGEIDN